MKIVSNTFTDSAGNVLDYCSYNKGDRVLICFPGFGETFESFSNLAKKLPQYRLVGINLYFVGKSVRANKSKYLVNKEWKKTFGEFLQKQGIERFSVIGFSLGGRFSASTFGSFQDRMDHLVLVAPDGIMKRFTYQLATFPVFFRQLFHFLMTNPRLYFSMVDLLRVLKLINPFVAKFSKTQLQSSEHRMLVYKSWVTFKFLRLTNREFLKTVRHSSCQTTFIFGEKDKIIVPKRHLLFLSKMVNSKVHVLPYGHNKLVDNASNEILEALTTYTVLESDREIG